MSPLHIRKIKQQQQQYISTLSLPLTLVHSHPYRPRYKRYCPELVEWQFQSGTQLARTVIPLPTDSIAYAVIGMNANGPSTGVEILISLPFTTERVIKSVTFHRSSMRCDQHANENKHRYVHTMLTRHHSGLFLLHKHTLTHCQCPLCGARLACSPTNITILLIFLQRTRKYIKEKKPQLTTNFAINRQKKKKNKCSMHFEQQQAKRKYRRCKCPDDNFLYWNALHLTYFIYGLPYVALELSQRLASYWFHVHFDGQLRCALT